MARPRYREYIPGGYAAGKRPSDFPRAALRRGTRVEMEHTRNPRIAREIAMDHLTEDPRYYQKLAKLHLDGAQRGDKTRILRGPTTKPLVCLGDAPSREAAWDFATVASGAWGAFVGTKYDRPVTGAVIGIVFPMLIHWAIAARKD